jgi:hypothetical protein|tara:strand:- start:229 stop:1248 length:1020 start_codon:yes stop_codon:yes gene_type:complete
MLALKFLKMVKLVTSNTQIWNIHSVVSQITHAMINDENIVLDFIGEGPDVSETVLDKVILELANKYQYDTKRITVVTANQVQKHNVFSIEKSAPLNLVNNAKKYAHVYTKDVKKHFGIFIGRSNGPRLDLASYIYNAFHNESYVTYHYSLSSEYHRNNIGLEELVTDFNQIDISVPASFLKHCPIVDSTIEPVAQSDLNPAQQLLKNDNDKFLTRYCNFLVEIVCETCYNGNTFFPTEKTWRPMLLETPFIVQGPQWYLHRLRDMGFQTFDRWWDEGYSEDPANWQNTEIKKVIDYVGKLSIEQLKKMYNEMQPTLKHNKKRFLELTSKDFEIFKNDKY